MYLDTLDNQILDLLNNQELHPSEIARRIHIPRTTVHYRLQRMEKHRHVKKKVEGRKIVWSSTIRKKHNKNIFRIYEGRDIVQAYAHLSSISTNSIVLVVQGSDAAKKELSTLPTSFIKEIHRKFKQKDIILKGITNKKILEAFSGVDKSLVGSHLGRTVGLKLFQDNRFLSSGEIMVAKNFVLLSNLAEQRAIVVKDKHMSHIVYDTLELIFEILDGRNSFDLNTFLREKMEE